MYKRILIADDLDSINQGIYMTIRALSEADVTQVHYCDDAYLKIKKGELDEKPFELLITDLSFVSDHRPQRFSNGEELIHTLRVEHPDLRIIAYSIEDRLLVVKRLVETLGIHAYVCKSRTGLMELSEALNMVHHGSVYISPRVQLGASNNNMTELEGYHLKLIRYLADGRSQSEIARQFKEEGVQPSSLSAIEKQLNRLKIQFKANNVVHLVAIVKDMGII